MNARLTRKGNRQPSVPLLLLTACLFTAAASAHGASAGGLPGSPAVPDTSQSPVSPAPQPTASDDELGALPGYLTFYLDNDLFTGTDRDYTNGLRLSWISESRPLFKRLPARRQLEKMSGAKGGDSWYGRLSGFSPEDIENGDVVLNYGFSMTQEMYTPEDFSSPTQPVGERRYAGWLGLGFSVHASDEFVLNSVELIFGTTGPRSLAEKSQKFIHDLRGIENFEGWDDQIPNEFTLGLAFTQKRRLRFLERPERALSVDGFAEWGLRLGSFRTGARAGGLIRAGYNLPADFSDPRISSTAYSHQFFAGPTSSVSDWSIYGLFGANAGAVLFDATLDGPLFKNFETGNQRETWVMEAYAGFGIRWRMLELSYVQTWRSKTYTQQDGSASFGSLALRMQLKAF